MNAAPYRILFTALDHAEELQTCLASVADLVGSDGDLDARMNGGRDRLATLLGYLNREHRAAMVALRDALRETEPGGNRPA